MIAGSARKSSICGFRCRPGRCALLSAPDMTAKDCLSVPVPVRKSTRPAAPDPQRRGRPLHTRAADHAQAGTVVGGLASDMATGQPTDCGERPPSAGYEGEEAPTFVPYLVGPRFAPPICTLARLLSGVPTRGWPARQFGFGSSGATCAGQRARRKARVELGAGAEGVDGGYAY